MYNHQPEDYACPFCTFLAGPGDKYTTQADIVYQNDSTTVVVAPRWWSKNPGSLLVVPNQHFENLYDITDEAAAAVAKTVKRAALALRATYDCDGTSTRQHNEPAGGQDVWHYHVQVLPRYTGDQLYQNTDQNRFASAAERAPYAQKLKAYFAEHKA